MTLSVPTAPQRCARLRTIWNLGAADRAYKRDALGFLSDHFRWDDATPVGELELVNTGETVHGTLILMGEWRAKLPGYL